jgi:hypothetical protein
MTPCSLLCLFLSYLTFRSVQHVSWFSFVGQQASYNVLFSALYKERWSQAECTLQIPQGSYRGQMQPADSAGALPANFSGPSIPMRMQRRSECMPLRVHSAESLQYSCWYIFLGSILLYGTFLS